MSFPDYPWTSRYLEIDGQRLHYLDVGPRDGKVVVMLHGNPSWSYYFRHAIRALEADYRCIVPDHIGMGLSSKPGADAYDFHFQRRADDLDRLLTHLGISGPLTLMLHDWGGMIGMTWALRDPEQVEKLVLLNTAAFHLPASKSLPWSLRFSRIPLVNAILNQGLNAFARGAVRYCVTRRPMDGEVAAAYLAPYDSWHNRLAVRRFVEDIPLRATDRGYDTVTRVADSLARYRDVPVLIGWGLRDFVFDHHFLQEWRKQLPQAIVYEYEDAGHYVLEDAATELMPHIRDFLSGTAASHT